MPSQISSIVMNFSEWLWSVPMPLILLGAHLFCTFCTGGIQRKTLLGVRLSLQRQPGSSKGISPFAALATSLASTVGTGNIIGVGTALALGGPGALFWCWLTGILGIATKYAESLLAVRYRVQLDDGSTAGGAMYVLSKRLRLPRCAGLFAAFTALAALGIGCGVQANAIATVLEPFSVNPLIVGAVVCLLTALVVFGGVNSISAVCARLVPLIGALFLFVNLLLLWQSRAFLDDALGLILSAAFTPNAACGGLIGGTVLQAVRTGTARGLFSNESGMGSGPIIAGAVHTHAPARMALISATATFWDTVVLFAVTGLAVVAAALRTPALCAHLADGGGTLTAAAFGQIPVIGAPVAVLSMILFAFSTILGWCYCGETAVRYLLGTRALPVYRILFCAAALPACVMQLPLVWAISDILNALMAVPNLIAVFLLSHEIRRITQQAAVHFAPQSCPAFVPAHAPPPCPRMSCSYHRVGHLRHSQRPDGCP